MYNKISSFSDTEMLDFLESLTTACSTEYTGRYILRQSTTGRGWRLHETSQPGAYSTVREAIQAYMESQSC